MGAVLHTLLLIVPVEAGIWARASWCQMPTNRREPKPQSPLTAFVADAAILMWMKDEFATGADLLRRSLLGYSRAT